MGLIIKLLTTEDYLISNNQTIKTTNSLDEVRRYGVFIDLIEVNNMIRKFDDNLELGKDYIVVSIKITEEIQTALDVRLLIKILPILLDLIAGNLTHQEFNNEIRKIKKNWSWHNCFKWMTGLKVQKALGTMTDEDLMQANVTKIEVLALISAIKDWDNGNV